MPDSAPIVKMKELPCGMYNARLDDKGRLKLPTQFQRYFGALDDPRLFVTSLDRRIARIFPLALWRAHEHFIETYAGDPKLPKRMLFNAADLGGEAEMDAQGRVLFAPELRRELGLEDQTLRLFAYRGRIEVLSEKLYEERRQASLNTATKDVQSLYPKGLK